MSTAGGRARVVILAGPSGSGKSRLSARLHATHGWPIVRLDDFYRDEDDPAMPRSRELGIIDWDDPASWDGDAAVAALERLVTTGTVSTPVYDISLSRAIGAREIRCRADDLVLAEGIFAAEVIGELSRRGLLAAAYCIHRPRLLTFCWRLLRDLSEHRKPAWTLVRRGLGLMRAEPRVVARQAALGARPVRPATVVAELRGGSAEPAGRSRDRRSGA